MFDIKGHVSPLTQTSVQVKNHTDVQNISI